jgi:outer membrane protein OmpA-like peptidoglycan-associated protein
VPERIVLHGLHFQRRRDKIDNSSIAILDYAARTIKDNPRAIICVEISSARSGTERRPELQDELTNRRVQAVASYLQQKGVDADKLVFVFPAVV